MASDSDIRTAITGAEALAITPAEMVALLDRAIAEFYAGNGAGATVGMVSYSIGGRSVTKSIDHALKARDYFHERAKEESSGGVRLQASEWRPSHTPWGYAAP